MWPFTNKKETTPKVKLMLESVMRTHTGIVREHNEDNMLWFAADHPEDALFTLALVADGMGGHAAGEVASKICTETFTREMQSSNFKSPGQLLQSAIQHSNNSIYRNAEAQIERKGMGTTCSALLFCQTELWLLNVGDSRSYHLNKGNLKQLSIDDTYVNQLLNTGEISEAEALTHPKAHILTKAVGTNEKLVSKSICLDITINHNDIFLICSDGLYDMISYATLKQMLQSEDALDVVADKLIQAALDGGGKDNISLILIKCLTEKFKEDKNSGELLVKTGKHKIPNLR